MNAAPFTIQHVAERAGSAIASNCLTSPRTREQLDEIVGCSNSPEVVRQLRGLFEGDGKKLLICERITFIDRDGRPCNPGVYALVDAARKAIYAWIARRKREAVTIKQGGILC